MYKQKWHLWEHRHLPVSRCFVERDVNPCSKDKDKDS